MLTIGEFSRICFVTKKTLRHYDEIGLLRPEHTAENGYRYYTTGQLRTMLLISRLKGYGFSLPEIAAVLARPEGEYLEERLREKRRELERQLEDTARLLSQLDRDADRLKRRLDIMDNNFACKTITLEAQPIYGVRRRIHIREFPEMFARLFEELERKGIKPAGAPLAFYHEEEFNQEDTDIEVAVAVADPAESTRTLEGGLCCCTTLVGPYLPDRFTAAYAGICRWIEDNGYRMTGSPFDKYVRGGDMCPPEEYVTEIYFPIAK